jgi:hypothetical protein
MTDLARWIGAQLDEDERIARAATSGPWRAHDTHLGQYGYAATVLSGEGNDTDLRAWLPSMSNEPWDETRNVWADAAFIAEHDPARVLRDIDRDRRTLVRCQEAMFAASPMLVHFAKQTLREMALSFSDRAGYAEAVASAG